MVVWLLQRVLVIGTAMLGFRGQPMECIIGLLKTEYIHTTVIHASPCRTANHVEYAATGWVDWYNNRRSHSSLGFTTPAEYETTHYAAPNREP